MSDNAEIIGKLRSYFESEKAGAVSELSDDDSLLDAGFLDSLAIVRLLAWLEETFAVEVPDDDLDPDNFESLSAIAALIAEKAA